MSEIQKFGGDTSSVFIPMTSVSSIIVNYRSAELVVESLPSLIQEIEQFSEPKIYVVENESPGDDFQILSREIKNNGWSDVVSLQSSGRNKGFADGNNVALQIMESSGCTPDYVYLVNPDARVRDGAIKKMVEFLDTHMAVGIVGSRLEGPDGSPQISAFNFPTITGEFIGSLGVSILYRLFQKSLVAPPQEDSTYQTDWISGASMMIRSKVFENIRRLDAGYFLYLEETDFMLNAGRAGWETWYLDEARVLHLGGQSTGVQNGQFKDGSIPLYWFDSWRRYYVKNHGRTYAILAATARLLGMILNRGHKFVRGKGYDGARNAIRQMIAYGLWPLLVSRDPLRRLHNEQNSETTN